MFQQSLFVLCTPFKQTNSYQTAQMTTAQFKPKQNDQSAPNKAKINGSQIAKQNISEIIETGIPSIKSKSFQSNQIHQALYKDEQSLHNWAVTRVEGFKTVPKTMFGPSIPHNPGMKFQININSHRNNDSYTNMMISDIADLDEPSVSGQKDTQFDLIDDHFDLEENFEKEVQNSRKQKQNSKRTSSIKMQMVGVHTMPQLVDEKMDSHLKGYQTAIQKQLKVENPYILTFDSFKPISYVREDIALVNCNIYHIKYQVGEGPTDFIHARVFDPYNFNEALPICQAVKSGHSHKDYLSPLTVIDSENLNNSLVLNFTKLERFTNKHWNIFASLVVILKRVKKQKFSSSFKDQ